jgi:hypothetical protein
MGYCMITGEKSPTFTQNYDELARMEGLAYVRALATFENRSFFGTSSSRSFGCSIISTDLGEPKVLDAK